MNCFVRTARQAVLQNSSNLFTSVYFCAFPAPKQHTTHKLFHKKQTNKDYYVNKPEASVRRFGGSGAWICFDWQTQNKNENLIRELKKCINELNPLEFMISFFRRLIFFYTRRNFLKKESHSVCHSPELFLYQI